MIDLVIVDLTNDATNGVGMIPVIDRSVSKVDFSLKVEWQYTS